MKHLPNEASIGCSVLDIHDKDTIILHILYGIIIRMTENKIISLCRCVMVLFFAFCFMIAQAAMANAMLSDGQQTVMMAKQSSTHAKNGCCCCKPLFCPCDMKKGKASKVIDNDFVFAPKTSDQTPEKEYPLQVTVMKSSSNDGTYPTNWVFARAPCPIIYLATLNLLC